ncbi:MAG: ankyrin repeat domain-containing protein [Planctomycetota bacterium]|nr:MAG: ankyrin repeat domain-containing protein [Planctomycetota bacterium]
MKLYFKLTIFVLVLFALVIATCLLWTPVKIRYYVGKLQSDDPKEQVAGVSGLLDIGAKGRKALVEHYNCSEKEIEFLAKYWANCNEPVNEDEFGRYPLHLASEDGWKDAAGLFLTKGVSVNVKSKGGTGMAALHYAAGIGHKDIVALLILKNADVNAKDNLGMTPLHFAAWNNYKETVDMLILKGVDVNGMNFKGKTPLDITRDDEIKSLLRSHGAKTGEELKKSIEYRVPSTEKEKKK